MVIVLVKIDDMLRREGVPVELSSYIMPHQWNVITEGVLKAHSDAHFWACCCEVTLCFIFVFPCVFCCHPCLSQSLLQNNLSSKLTELNISLFGGFPVMSVTEDCIMFNSSHLAQAEPIYLDRTNTTDALPVASAIVKGPSQYQDQSGYVTMNPVVHQPVATRSMVVRVPPTAGPGSVLTVTAPNGSILSVVVPASSAPGMDLIVQY